MKRWIKILSLALLAPLVVGGVLGCSLLPGGDRNRASEPQQAQTVTEWLGQDRPEF